MFNRRTNVALAGNVLAVGAVRLLTIKLNKMTELQRQFMEETGVSFDGIPINGVHLEYITWLEAQIQALRQPTVISSVCKHPMRRREYYRDKCYKCFECLKIVVEQTDL